MIKSRKELIDFVASSEKIAIYGAGNVGRGVADFLAKQYSLDKVHCFVVSGNPEENKMFEKPVISLSNLDLTQKDLKIIVATKSNLHEIITNNLRENGLSDAEYVDDSLGEELIRQRRGIKCATQASLKRLEDRVYRMTPQGRLHYFVLNILDHCNLNCAGCDHFAPLANKRCIPLEQIKNDLFRFSEIMGGKADIIGIMGGEPLMHPDIIEICRLARDAFPNSKIQIDTNGILLLKQEKIFWDSCRNNKITIVNTKYPIPLDHEKIEQKCFEEKVKFEYYGKTGEVQKTLFKIPFDLDGKQDPRKSFEDCFHANHCITLMEGRIYPCTIAPNAHIFNDYFGTSIDIEDGDFLDIYDDVSRADVLNFVSNPIPFCRYCAVSMRSFGYPWTTSERSIKEWTLTECEKHPKERRRIEKPREELKFEVHLTEHCNLNCRGCFHFSSIAKEEFLSVEEYKNDCCRLSELYNGNASRILLLGGEPLLHPEIKQFINITRSCFINAEIIVVTNGILLLSMNEDFWKCCRDNNVILEPTKYPIHVDYKGIEEKAKTNGVRLNYFNNGKVEKTLTFQPIDLNGGQNKEDNFYGCYRANLCITLKHGKLYTCIIPAHIHHFAEYFDEKLPDFGTDGIDIYSASSADEISMFLTQPIEACRYCDRAHTTDGYSWGVTKREKTEWTLLESKSKYEDN